MSMLLTRHALAIDEGFVALYRCLVSLYNS
jgi:hypothetical protein